MRQHSRSGLSQRKCGLTLIVVNPTATPVESSDSRTLAASLAPLLVQACEGRLSDIHWFKTDWQRGGAATGRASLSFNGSANVPVVIKLPVVQRELLWVQRLNEAADDDPVTPRLYFSGESIGGYDLAWLVIEQFPHGPLGLHWHEDHVLRIADAAARFHAAAAAFPVDQPPRHEPWHELIAQAHDSIKTNHIHHEQRWAVALKTLRHKLDSLVREWESRAVDQWQHGDLHLANAMSRVSNDAGPVCLIDLAEVHAGHWIEDAVYLERQLWARPQRMTPHKPVKSLAVARKHHGLSVEADYPRLAMIRRALLAATAPRFIKSEGHPAYLEACLDRLEIALNELK
jgi:hypothetical protein